MGNVIVLFVAHKCFELLDIVYVYTKRVVNISELLI